MSARIDWAKVSPDAYKALIGLEQALAKTGLENSLIELIRLRASQINGCAFCTRMHTRDAIAVGESVDRISVLPAWRETSYFDVKEQAALDLVEAITRVADGHVPDDVYERAASRLSRDDNAAVEWLSIVINAWNRIAIASRYPVGE